MALSQYTERMVSGLVRTGDWDKLSDEKFDFTSARKILLNNINNWYNKIDNTYKYILFFILFYGMIKATVKLI